MNAAAIIHSHIAYVKSVGLVPNATRISAWVFAHSTLGRLTHNGGTHTLIAANCDVVCYCCGQTVNGTMIALDHVANDGHMDMHNESTRLSGSKLAEAWYREFKAGREYHTELRSICANCNASKNATGGECQCEAARNRRNAFAKRDVAYATDSKTAR